MHSTLKERSVLLREGSFGYLGYIEEYLGVSSIVVPLSQRPEAEKLGWTDGNVPIGLLSIGTPQQVKDYAKKLIDTAGKGGAFIMTSAAVIEKAKPENIHAMIDFTKGYGVYRR